MDATDQEFIELVATEGGILAAVLLVILVPAVVAMFWVMKAFISRVLDRQEKLISDLTTEQSRATSALAENVARVEKAVIRSDGHNTASIDAVGVNIHSLRESLSSRLDGHDGRHEKHDARHDKHETKFTLVDGEIRTLTGSHTLLDYRVTAIEKRLP